MQTLTRNRTARLTLIAAAFALLIAIAVPIAAYAQSSRPAITAIKLVKDSNAGFKEGRTITADVRFDQDVRITVPWDDVQSGEHGTALRLTIGTDSRDAQYIGVVEGDSSIRRYRYTVQATDAFKSQRIHAERMVMTNSHYVSASGDADGCENGEWTQLGLMMLPLLPMYLLQPGGLPEEYYDPYTCWRYASRLDIPNSGNPLQYDE